jgi:hypothetical protein
MSNFRQVDRQTVFLLPPSTRTPLRARYGFVRTLRELHNRMPVILAPDVRPAWLGEKPADEA